MIGKCRTKNPFVRHLPYTKSLQKPLFRERIPLFHDLHVVEMPKFIDLQVVVFSAPFFPHSSTCGSPFSPRYFRIPPP
jgi:hypothetical protein